MSLKLYSPVLAGFAQYLWSNIKDLLFVFTALLNVTMAFKASFKIHMYLQGGPKDKNDVLNKLECSICIIFINKYNKKVFLFFLHDPSYSINVRVLLNALKKHKGVKLSQSLFQ